MSRQVPSWFLFFGAAILIVVVALAYRRSGGTAPVDSGPQTASQAGAQTGSAGSTDAPVSAPGAALPSPGGAAPQIAPLAAAQSTIERHAAAFRLESGSALVLKQATVDGNMHHYRYGQTHLGVPVEGVGLTLSEDSSARIDSVFGQPARGLADTLPVIAPKLDAQAAIALALKAWLGADHARYAPHDEAAVLVVHVGQVDAHLAYRVTFSADSSPKGGPTSPWILVDAGNGEILSRQENLQTLGGGSR
jgi:Zn-dependent metalloprotease